MLGKVNKTSVARAELDKREWLEFEVRVTPSGQVEEVIWRGFGCGDLLSTAEKFASALRGQVLSDFCWNSGHSHSDILTQEILDKLTQKFKIPLVDEELCHCRKIATKKVDEAVVLGAHTPELVRSWTTASSGCGTCRPEVVKIIESRIGKVLI